MNPITSLYIHIPFCISKCKYCDFFSIPCGKEGVSDEYIDAVCNEITYRLKDCGVQELRTVYIGGGTPSLLSFEQLKKIFCVINKNTHLHNDCEVTIEVNPDDISEKLLEEYSVLGINRISCGIQSMNDESLKFASRRASSSINKRAITLLSAWKGVLSLDVICGLPGESKESFISGLNEIIKINPQHISMYSLTIEDETPFGKLYLDGKLNLDFDYSDEMWLLGKEILENAGYTHYEVSNFSKPGYECKHNLVYWNHEGYLGCGSGATGTYYNDDGSGTRITNLNDISEYLRFWNYEVENMTSIPQQMEIITEDISIFEYFMMGLRKISGIQETEFKKIFNKDIPEKILNTFYEWNQNQRCVITGKKGYRNFTLGKKGILFLNKFLNEII